MCVCVPALGGVRYILLGMRFKKNGAEKRQKKRTKTTPTTPTENLPAEDQQLLATLAAEDPKVAQKYEYLQKHALSPERKKQVTRRNALIGGGLVVAGLFGFRQYNLSRRDTGPEQALVTAEEAIARAFAAEFCRDWFTWDSNNVEDRQVRLARYNPSFTGREGWDGLGAQQVIDSWATESTLIEGATFAVTVGNRIAESVQPIYAEIRVYVADGGASALSYPNLVAAPALPVSDATQNSLSTLADKAAEEEVARRLQVFFRAWGDADTATLESVCVTGYTVNPMLSGHSFGSLSDTQYYAPATDDPAAGTIIWVVTGVTWVRGESRVKSNYEVVFTLENGKWLISEVDAAELFEPAMVK